MFVEEGRVTIRAWATLAVLGTLYVLSFIDRFVIALLVRPLKAELALSDLQLGLLFGTFFALFYGALGLPIARLADRRNRKWLVVGGVLLWSAATTASAFAVNYATLAGLRFGLAVGEAALVPAAFSMLTDMFPPRCRIMAGTIFSACGMLGASCAFLLGAAVLSWAEAHSASVGISAWRLTFLAVGLPGTVIALVFALTAREPIRRESGAASTMRGVLAYLGMNRRLYAGLFVGAGAAQMISYAVLAWSVTLMERSFGLSSAVAGTRIGLATVVASVGGTLIVPTLFHKVMDRSPVLASQIPAVATGIGGALIVVAATMSNATGFLFALTLGGFLLIGATNAVVILVQPLAPSEMRATLTALVLICISGVGMGLGPPAVAVAASWWGDAATSVAGGLGIVAAVGMIVAAGSFAMAIQPLCGALARMVASDRVTGFDRPEQKGAE
ncbi:MFS transporter [Sphingomonas sp. GB1N7]|uniref:MFS transporter n=1 Tax=Parasphingomonas caseinilytica TaxID=3096158 RepID=UPI002FCC86B9